MWKKEFTQLLPLMGHRNWILVVDQAYPLQSAAGMRVIDTQEPLKSLLSELLRELDAAPHVKPVVYTDRELGYLDESLCPGVSEVQADLQSILAARPVQTILHEEVFARIDEASKLFNILVLKTTSRIPYSSVFIELDCGYWNAQAEKTLRERMADTSSKTGRSKSKPAKAAK